MCVVYVSVCVCLCVCLCVYFSDLHFLFFFNSHYFQNSTILVMQTRHKCNIISMVAFKTSLNVLLMMKCIKEELMSDSYDSTFSAK